MSILIKGMEMPQGCYNCPLQHRGFNGSETVHYCYVIEREVSDDGETDTDCPLVEVPPHGRLIDEDALISTLLKFFDERKKEQMYTGSRGAFVTWNDAIYYIKSAPIIIEAEE